MCGLVCLFERRGHGAHVSHRHKHHSEDGEEQHEVAHMRRRKLHFYEELEIT